jgi:coproporphyrinogen III oxidase-like Fe-S oxidoreductase
VALMGGLDTLSSSLLRVTRRALTGERSRLAFGRCREFSPPPIDHAGIYVHVPYCRSLCPYCPYLRVPYRPAAADSFAAALLQEIAWYAGTLPDLRTDSVYFGGGTPTVLGRRLGPVVEALRERFQPAGPWCIETNPADLDLGRIGLLKTLGFDSVSLGVQSFDDRTLRFLGRDYRPGAAQHALDAIAAAGIPSLNVDLMFAIPGQSESSWRRDLELAIASPASQVTAYPLFTFPYSEIGERHALDGMRMPPWRVRRRMYYELHDRLCAAGFRRVSVWSFQRGAGHRFSSVTRSRYLGFGPSGGSCFSSLFTLNTFSPEAYADSVARRGHAVALQMPMSERLEQLMELYWRAYDTRLGLGRWRELTASLPRLGYLLAAARRLGWCEQNGDELSLTRRGSFWVHLLQNHAVLPGVSRLWSAGKREPWPDTVALQ